MTAPAISPPLLKAVTPAPAEAPDSEEQVAPREAREMEAQVEEPLRVRAAPVRMVPRVLQRGQQVRMARLAVKVKQGGLEATAL